ncbi:MAG: hypothetical protein RLZZ591_208 [Pseudomonadota bacterium]|jgi:transglutaminase-like putative cysteine protease
MWHRLKTLPRDARDTLFLLGVICWVILPHAPNLPVWCTAMAVGVLSWRGWLAWHARPLPSAWWRTGLLTLTLGATWISHQTLLGRDAGVTLIVVLLTLKTLEMRARRDAFVVFFLSFFTLLTHFFFSQSLLTAMAMLLALLGLLTALVNAHRVVGKPPLAASARMAGGMALLGAPIMVLLFVLFPRVAPLWGIPADGLSGRSGLSGSMQVGSIASLALDDSLAMRIQFDGRPPPQSELYFRGPVLSQFDGREWRAASDGRMAPARSASRLSVQGEAYRYQVTLEPSNRPWLMLLDATPRPPALNDLQARMTSELQWLADRPLTDRTRYTAESYTHYTYGRDANRATLLSDVELPTGYNPRTLQLAADLRRTPGLASASNATVTEAVLQRLRTGGYVYTLEPGVFGQHTADEFWFDRKQGFCEHIASSFVVLMRALDVPARVVTGYQGGTANTVDGYWSVRNSDAHAWAEVWLEDRGWTRVDPTSAVAPSRTGTLERLLPPRGLVASALGGAISTISPSLLLHLRELWEASNHRWNQWVLNYTPSQQLQLLRDLGFDSPDWQDLLRLLVGALVLASLAGAAWTLRERRQQDAWQALLSQAKRRCAKAGLALPAHAPPRTMAYWLGQQDQLPPALRRALQEWLLEMEAVRYSPASDIHHQKQALKSLKMAWRRMPWPR